MTCRIAAALIVLVVSSTAGAMTPDEMRRLAQEFYDWRDQDDPVSSSDAGKHTWDDRLADYSPPAMNARASQVTQLPARLPRPAPSSRHRHDPIDWLLLRAQLERLSFASRVLKPETQNPGIYVGEASNGIFSLLKKEYAPPRDRALAATARLRAVPAMLEQAKRNLRAPVRLYAELAAQSARAVDPLYQDSLMVLAKALSAAEGAALVKARDEALVALHAFADWLDKKAPSLQPWKPMGELAYDEYLSHVLLLPLTGREVAELGEVELARYRALEAMLHDPSLADPDPRRAAHVPADQQAFLAAYESRETEMIKFLKERKIITIPDYIGPFLIKQLPEAFKPTSPGGFMNPPGLYDRDPSGFYFIPTYNAESKNFYLRAAV